MPLRLLLLQGGARLEVVAEPSHEMFGMEDVGLLRIPGHGRVRDLRLVSFQSVSHRFDAFAADFRQLFTLIAERYERRSLGITSNLVFNEWEKLFDNPVATAAAIDRIVHHSVILEFDVPSYRTDAAQYRRIEEESDRQE